MARAMSAAIHLSVGLDAVSDDPALAVRTPRREQVNRALETVEGMGLAAARDLKRLVIVVAADFAPGHGGPSFVYVAP